MKAKLNDQERKELRRETLEVNVPGVYWSGVGQSHLLLTLARNSGNINYTDSRTGSYESCSASEFSRQFPFAEAVNPTHLALNLLGRATEGFWLSVRVHRRLISMVTKEELMKLSERALGKEYSRIMGLDKPISKISSDEAVRGKYVDQMLEKLASQPAPEAAAADAPAGDQSSTTPTTPEAQTAADAPGTTTPAAAEGEDEVAKKAAKAKKKAAKQESARTVSYDKVAKSVKNPYREASKKHKAFEIFRDGGERGDILKAVGKLGVTDATAASWVNLFRKVK